MPGAAGLGGMGAMDDMQRALLMSQQTANQEAMARQDGVMPIGFGDQAMDDPLLQQAIQQSMAQKG